MAQDTAFGRAALSTYIQVKKADGTLRYFKVVNGENMEISQEVYLSGVGEE